MNIVIKRNSKRVFEDDNCPALRTRDKSRLKEAERYFERGME